MISRQSWALQMVAQGRLWLTKRIDGLFDVWIVDDNGDECCWPAIELDERVMRHHGVPIKIVEINAVGCV